MPTHNLGALNICLEKRPSHFRVPCGSDRTSRARCSEIRVPVCTVAGHPIFTSLSVSHLSSDSLPPLSLIALYQLSDAIYCFNLLSFHQPHSAHSHSSITRLMPGSLLSWCLPLSRCMWIDGLNVRLSDRGHNSSWRTPGDNRCVHVPAASAWWSERWVYKCVHV